MLTLKVFWDSRIQVLLQRLSMAELLAAGLCCGVMV